MKPHLPIPLRRVRRPMPSTMPGYPHFAQVPAAPATVQAMAAPFIPPHTVLPVPTATTPPEEPEKPHAKPAAKKR